MTLSIAASRFLSRPLDRVLPRLPTEFFLLFVVALVVGMAAIAEELGLSEAIGALMAGIVLAETSVARRDRGTLPLVPGPVRRALLLRLRADDRCRRARHGRLARRARGRAHVDRQAGLRVPGRRRRRLHAPPEPQRRRRPRRARRVHHHPRPARRRQRGAERRRSGRADRPSPGLYVLATATIGIVLMKESKRFGRALFRPPRLAEEEAA